MDSQMGRKKLSHTDKAATQTDRHIWKDKQWMNKEGES